MKLYYSPGACSLSPHIVLHESGLAFQHVLASTKTHKLEDGTDYYGINPKGYVPLLELDDGTRLSEGPVIVQYIADQVPTKNLAPANGTMPRYRLQEWLNFITAELHKQFAPLFNQAYPAEAKELNTKKINGRLEYVNAQLEGKQYLVGDTFSVADAYLYVILRWSRAMKVEGANLPNLVAYYDRIDARPAVQQALKHEAEHKA
ncbi:MAG: gst [Rhizobacter sp.]|nr:gst [Rhizobacter sp.]